MKKSAAIILSSLVLLSACSNNNTPSSSDANTSSEPNTSSSETSQGAGNDISDEVHTKMTEIHNWAENDVWNNGFNLIQSYAHYGADADGNVIDFDEAMKNFDEAYAKHDEYDAYIRGLEGDEYEGLRTQWGQLSDEMKNLHGIYRENEVTAGDTEYPLDTTNYSEYHRSFTDELSKFRRP